MSNSLLYHAFGIRVYEHKRTHYDLGRVRFDIRLDRDRWRCPTCGLGDVVNRGYNYRYIRTIPIGGRPVLISVSVPKVDCRKCGTIRYVELGFADSRRSYTKAFERYAVELLQHMTIAGVAQHLGVGWDLIKDIHKRHLGKKYSKPRLRDLKIIAIDEINVGKGRFLTLVLDLVGGAVVHVGESRKGAALDPFWRRLRASRAKIEAVAMDMSNAYRRAVLDNLPGAKIVFDRFHIMKLYNKKLSDFRRELQREVSAEQHQVLKGTRWLLLTNRDTLKKKSPEKLRKLDRALRLNEPLAKAYYMKELLRLFWQFEDRDPADMFLRDWIDEARASGVRMLDRFADTIEAHEQGLLDWYDYPISTGPLEGVNNKIGTLQNQAYGYRDKEYFKLRILGLHETEYALVG